MGGGSSSSAGASEAPNSLISDSLLRITDLLCEGPISGFALQSGAYGNDPLTSTYFNDVQVRNLDGSYNFNISGQGFQFAWTLGTSGQYAMSGFEHVTVQVPLPQDTRLSNPLVNAGLPKELLVTFNTNQYPDANSVLISFRIPEMYTADDKGNTNGFEIDTSIDCSLNNGTFVNLGTQSFVGKNTTPYFRTIQYTLPITTPPQSFYQWTLKFSKTSNDVDSVQTVDDIYVDSVAIISTSQFNYPNSALVGLYIDALQFGIVPSRAYLIQGMLVSVPSGYTPTQYNPNTSTITPANYPAVWNGTFTTGVWTDNPAWIFYDLISNPRYGLGQYINTANIDIWTLYQVSQYCDQMVDNGLNNGGLEPQFTLNAFIQQPDDAYNMLLNLSSAFRGMLYYGNGTIRANTTDNKSPVFNYTNANVINGVFNYSSTARSARHNACQVKYSDPTNLYRDNYILIEDNSSIIQYGYNKKDITAFGCASAGQATRVANWILTTERLRTETVSFQVGEDGLFVRPGDVFNVYDNFRMNKSQGGRVTSFDSTQKTITLDRPVNLDSGCIYSLTCVVPTFNYDATGDVTGSNQIPQIRNPQIQSCQVLNADISGLQTLQVSGGFSGLMKNAVWILSATGVYTSGYVPTVFQQAPQYECLSISDQSPGILNVLGLNYNTGINYTINTGFSVIFNAINSGNLAVPPPVTNFTGNLITGQLNNNSFFTYINLTWSPAASSNVSFYSLSGTVGTTGGNALLGNTTSTGFGYLSPVTGSVTFKICTVGKGGAYSAPQSCNFYFAPPAGTVSVDNSQIRFWLLPDGFGDLEQIAVLYNRPSPAITNTNIYYATGYGAPFRQVLDQSFYAAEGASISGLTASGTTAYITSNSYDMSTIVGQTAIQQANNSLLWLVDNELMSVGGFSGLSGNNYAFSISRGVLGTFAAPHSVQTTGWLFYSTDLPSFTDASITQVFNYAGAYDTGVATRYFQVQNNTAVLDGAITPASPGISYTLPNPNPTPPTNIVAIVGTGKIVRITWTIPNNTDILEYRVYRATGPGYSDTALIGTAGAVSLPEYDDINVVLGTTYQYWITTVAQNEQESVLSVGVIATPQLLLPSGVTTYPPADPGQITLQGSGNYFASDGSLLAYMAFNVPAPTSGTAYQNIVFQRYTGVGTNLTGAQIGAQISNSGASIASIYDLSPNVPYAFGSQSISNFGLFSPDIIVAQNSPITAPFSSIIAGAPGSPPNTPSGLVVSGGLGGTANFLALTWSPNVEPNFEEYGVYRYTGGATPSIPFAYVSSNSFIDANVTGGRYYVYQISAFNRNNQQSALTSSVSGSTENPPSDPSPISLNTSGVYYSLDGNVFGFLTFNVPPIPSGAVGQYVLYRTHCNINWMVGNDVSNTAISTSTLQDLIPGVRYEVASQSYSLNGIPSANTVAASGSPFYAPTQNAAPLPPTNLLISPASATGVPFAPPLYQNYGAFSTLVAASIVSWTPSISSGLSFYEVAWGTNSVFPPPTTPVPLTPATYSNYDITVPISNTSAVVYSIASTPAGASWVRSVDKFGNASVWSGVPSQGNFNYAGNMGLQNSTGVYVQQINSYVSGGFNIIAASGNSNSTVGNLVVPTSLELQGSAYANSTQGFAIGGSTARPVLVEYPMNVFVVITGSPTVFAGPAIIYIPIPSSAGFSHAPDTCSAFAINKPTNDVLVSYNYSGGSTSTDLYLKASTTDGSNFVSGFNLQLSLDLMEYM